MEYSAIPNQIDLTRTYKIYRNAFFSAKSFINRNKQVTDFVQNQYKYQHFPMLFKI
jgi:hypothetical protein